MTQQTFTFQDKPLTTKAGNRLEGFRDFPTQQMYYIFGNVEKLHNVNSKVLILNAYDAKDACCHSYKSNAWQNSLVTSSSR